MSIGTQWTIKDDFAHAGLADRGGRPADGNGNSGKGDVTQILDGLSASPQTEAAQKYNLPACLIRSVIQAESNFRPEAVSPAGAQGLMPLMPGTARDLGVTDPFDVDQNIDGGARYLRQMLDMFDGDLKQALAAYIAGPGTVMQYKGVVPFRETRAYVQKVTGLAGRKEEISAL